MEEHKGLISESEERHAGDASVMGKYPKDAVQHPIDELAQQILENRVASHPQVRGLLDKAAKELEAEFYLENLADNTRISPDLLPVAHRILTDTCSRLQVPLPALFLDTNVAPNA